MEAYNTHTDTDPPGFTPVRRKQSTVNAGRVLGDQEQEWTTARCHRLLRALTSRVAILSKEISRFSTASHQEEAKPKGYEFPRSKTTTPDDDWMHPRKKVKQTYSSRARGKGRGEQSMGRGRPSQPDHGRQSLMPGEVVVSTPILARARGEEWEPQPDPASPTERSDLPDERKKRRSRGGYVIGSDDSSWQLSGTLRGMKKKIDPSRYNTYEGIYTGLETLIKSTTKEEPEKKRKGARSLFSMTLKAVPRYIAEQEGLLSAHMHATGSKSAITSRDMSTEVYDDLESLGSSGKSWRHLRVIVRSHGILVISDAIRTGLLDVHFCGVLITLLVELSALEEAETLLSALLYSSPFPKPRTLYDPLDRRLKMLGSYAEHTGRVSFHYNQVSELITSGTLHVFWLATKGFGQVWTSLIQSISMEMTCTGARFAFLNKAMPILASAANTQPSGSKTMSAINSVFSEASCHTFSSLLTNIASIFILNTETRRFVTCDKLGYEYIVPLLRTCTIELQLSDAINGPQRVLLLLVQLIIESKVENSLDVSKTSRSILENLGQRNNFLDICTVNDDLALLVSNIARSCGRGASTSGFDYLQELHILLETAACKKDGDVLKGIIVDSAYAFADKTSDPHHLDYASCLDSRFVSRVAPAHQNEEDFGETRSGFRWEEGIGEWVTKTPALKIVQRKLSVSTTDGENECDTPLRPIPRLRKNTIQVLIQPFTAPEALGYSRVSSPIWDFDDLMGSTVPNSQSSKSSSDDELGIDDSVDDDSETSGSSVDDSFISHKSAIDKGRNLRPRAPIYKAPRLSKRPGLRTSEDHHTFNPSNPTPPSSQESIQTRQRIDRAPTGNRALRSTQTFQVFNHDESDDELSFVSISSPQAMRDVTNKKRPLRPQLKQIPHQKLKKRRVVSDSDDELCI